MINVIYTNVRGIWRFYASFSNVESLDREKKHLQALNEKFVVKMFPEFNMKEIEKYATQLNQ
jgi:hypothetical protein